MLLHDPGERWTYGVSHNRALDGKLIAVPELVLPQPPTMDMGGHGLYSTVGEYMKFIRMILNDGLGPNGRILKASTVTAMATSGLRISQPTASPAID